MFKRDWKGQKTTRTNNIQMKTDNSPKIVLDQLINTYKYMIS